ncbi:MAG: chemotaxis protein CheW [Planctomycetes bacterium]|nr:chemotaxis protein CheW [Planctomycetota bacterium]
MNATLEAKRDTAAAELQLATFYVGDILLGIDIQQVQEINRQLDVTEVPHSPDFVRGVINLRGDVATVVDLRTILGLPSAEVTRESRNLIVHSKGETIGFLVDRISDILALNTNEISPSPTTVEGVDGNLFKGIFKLETELLIILDVDAVLSGETK